MDFRQLGISEEISSGLEKQGIFDPTYIQEKSIPVIMEGKDVIAQSETGSGKTLAYLLPIFMTVKPELKTTQAIILTPTHELAVQVNNQLKILAQNSGSAVTGALVIGGANIDRQIDKLKTKPPVVIGSAGRIHDLIKKRKIQAHTVKTLVIDEADKMLDEDNISTTKDVIKTLMRDTQKVILSASIGKATVEAAKEFMAEPVLIEKENVVIPENINHYYIVADKRDGIVILRKILAGEKPKKVIVFINRPDNIEVLCEKLKFHGIRVGGIYGSAHKNDRKNTMDAFREGRIDVLVASDIGARGLDFEDVDYVINLDIPQEAVYYQHRAGRTGRNGKKGTVVSVVTPFEVKHINHFERVFKLKFYEKMMLQGKISDVTEKQKSINKSKISAMKERKQEKKNVSFKNKEKKDSKKFYTVNKEKNKK